MTTTTKTATKSGKAPAPKGRKRTHTKPAVSREAQQSEQIARTLYAALTAPDAPKASPMGYIMGATTLLKTLIDQAAQQGEDRGQLRSYALNLIARI